MNDTRTPIRPRARIDVSPEGNKHEHYPWYPNSRERSVSVEERDIADSWKALQHWTFKQ